MRCLIPAVLMLSLAGVAFGQGRNQSWSLGGFGSVVYPGMGHAPTATPPLGQFGGRGYNYGFSRGFLNQGFVGHNHYGNGSTVIVPYPVYYGGYYGYDPSVTGGSGYAPGPGYGPGYAPGPDDGSAQGGPGLPPVVINQSFVPPTANPQVRNYSGTEPQQSQQQPQDQSGAKLYAPQQQGVTAAEQQKPTIYLIALRDHTIVQALGYWMEGNTLHYVSAEQTLNQISLDLVDRDLSQRLNDERHVDFRLPPAR